MAQSELEQLRSLTPEGNFSFQVHLPTLYPLLEKQFQNYGGRDGTDITPGQIKNLFQSHLSTLNNFAATRPPGTPEKELAIRTKLIENISNLVSAGIDFETAEGKEAAEIWLDMLSQGESKKVIYTRERSAAETESERIQKTLAAAKQIVRES